MWPNQQFTVNLITFPEAMLNRKLHFLCSGMGGSNGNQLG